MNEKSKQRAEQMHCTAPELGNLVIFYLNDDITEEESRKIKEHLSHCESCKEDLRLFAIIQMIEEEAFAH